MHGTSVLFYTLVKILPAETKLSRIIGKLKAWFLGQKRVLASTVIILSLR